MIRFALILQFFAVFVVSCGGNFGTKEGKEDSLRSEISICSGGLDSGIISAIEAEYEKQKENIDDGFKKYVHAVLKANDVSEQRYESYINCVLAVDERERASYHKAECKSACDRRWNKCIKEKESEYAQCIERGKSSCLNECAAVFGLSKTQCDKECDTTRPYNISKWEKTHACDSAINKQCESPYTNCMATCN